MPGQCRAARAEGRQPGREPCRCGQELPQAHGSGLAPRAGCEGALRAQGHPRHPLELRGAAAPAGSGSSSQQHERAREGRTGWAVWEGRFSPHQPVPVPSCLCRAWLLCLWEARPGAAGSRRPPALAGQQPQELSSPHLSSPQRQCHRRGRLSQPTAPSRAQET